MPRSARLFAELNLIARGKECYCIRHKTNDKKNNNKINNYYCYCIKEMLRLLVKYLHIYPLHIPFILLNKILSLIVKIIKEKLFTFVFYWKESSPKLLKKKGRKKNDDEEEGTYTFHKSMSFENRPASI